MSNYGTNGNGRCGCRTGAGRAVPAAGRGFGGHEQRRMPTEYRERVADECGCGAATELVGNGENCGCASGCDSCINGYPLAMAYVPCQSFEDLYSEEEALCNGTIFKNLNLAFTGRRVKCNGK